MIIIIKKTFAFSFPFLHPHTLDAWPPGDLEYQIDERKCFGKKSFTS